MYCGGGSMPEKLLRMSEVAALIDTSLPRAYELVRQGVIPGVVRLGRQIRVNPDVLAEWITQGAFISAGAVLGGAKGVASDESHSSV
jgi:excisionase family DNA binding protein